MDVYNNKYDGINYVENNKKNQIINCLTLFNPIKR